MAISDIRIVQEVKIKDLDKIIKELKGIRNALEILTRYKCNLYGAEEIETWKNSFGE